MCGRYVSKDQAAIEREWNLTRGGDPFGPKYNAAPTDMLPVVRLDRSGDRRLALLRWGLIPYWAKDPSIGVRCINARADNVATKPAFRDAYRARRCLVPAAGYYEWKTTPTGKVPHFITSPDGSLMAFAGLWERWKPADGEPVASFTIVTSDSSMTELHDRMPVILEPENYDEWLTAKDPARLLVPCSRDRLRVYPVSNRVSNVRNQEPELLNPV